MLRLNPALQTLTALAFGLALCVTPACGDDDASGGATDTQTTWHDTSADAVTQDTTSTTSADTSQWNNVPTDTGSQGTSDTAPVTDTGYAADTAVPPDTTPPETGPGPGAVDPIATNPFTVANHDPLSTFGVDVDTASYDLLRRDLANGALPDKRSVRLEEYVNYFRYDYPAPAWDAAEPFAVHLEAAPSPYSMTDTTLFRVGIKAKVLPDDLVTPANLVFLVDVSGSMASPNKLSLVKVVLRETLEILNPTDTVSIVTYSGHVSLALPPTAASQKASIVGVIDGLTAGGSTAGGDAINLAYDTATEAWIEGGINHIILCTDGDFNVGISSDEALVRLIEAKRTTGVTLTALGFGSDNLNDSMMEAVSNAGDGVYAVVTDADQATAYVHNRLLGNLHYVAKDMKIQVVFNPATVYAYRLLGYENNAIADEHFVDDTVDAGEIGAGHTVTALYELVLNGRVVPAADDAPEMVDGAAYDGPELAGFESDDIARVQVRWKDPGASAEDAAFQQDFGLGMTRIAASFEAATDNLRWAASVAAFAEVLKESPYAILDNLLELEGVVDAYDGADPDRLEFQTLLDQVLVIITP